MQIVELEMVPLSLRPVLQRLYDMKTTQSALREGVLFSTKRNNYYYDTGTGKVIVLDDDTSYIFRVWKKVRYLLKRRFPSHLEL